ncbi:MAG: Eco57I restriction-modification methylase domain-containing protein [Chloroflexi bacterium]|nr:Eco57I restriction-modification methylase domain-containing protein [Chloroflexota bacterium]
MAVVTTSIRQRLKDFDFQGLFIEELGWDQHRALPLVVTVNEGAFSLQAVAEKRGMVAYVCQPDGQGAIPDYATRRKVERQAARSAHEHIIVYLDAAGTAQTWQWVKRELGKPTACREHTFHKSQPGDALIQKLQAIAFDLEEEDRLTIAEVAGRARQAFDVDRVTKRFYERFKAEHAAFLSFIQGITSQADREWYASLMLNRLMFIYFIQKKGFLDGDNDYLRHRLRMMRERQGRDKFLTFYRHFLLRLFHEGLGKEEKARSPELDALLGKVPYLNGGLFDQHKLEEDNPHIEIPDDAFQRLFDFFDAYQWHLDERPLRADNEINPDVLGYIFEKYVNQKQMGAYYTKEDITEYISKNTVIPFLFDAAQKECSIAFRPDSSLWRLLRDDPDRYIYEAVRRGVIDAAGAVIPESALPDFVQTGMHDPKARMFDKRYNLQAAELRDTEGNSLTLPTETWREYVARRTRCLDLRARLAAGEACPEPAERVHSINDLITFNLDIRQFAQDAIETCEGPELLRAFYHAIEKVSVLDPTCGSGAFLFAALNILEPLYQACLDRSGERHHPEKFSDFRKVLQQANDTARHPSHRYFILKTIVLNNLYGVDIMEEAVEICKLRLFLKLVAQVETAEPPVVPLRKGDGIEPLPDIDFNIRAGNTLVGFTSLDAVRQAMTMAGDGQSRMLSNAEQAILKRIDEDAELSDWAFEQFKESQSGRGMDAGDFVTGKQLVRESLAKLRDQLDRYLAGEYGVDVTDPKAYDKWRASHQPFHWFVEFYGVMKAGGFDVIIGNPPYKELRLLPQYELSHYRTTVTGDLYAVVLERALPLSGTVSRMGFIVPVSFISAGGYEPLQKLFLTGIGWFSSFDDRPSRLFDGLEHCRQTIWVGSPRSATQFSYSTRYNKWYSTERPTLFSTLRYARTSQVLIEETLPKLSEPLESIILARLQKIGKRLRDFLAQGNGNPRLYYSRKGGPFLDFIPTVLDGHGRTRAPAETKELAFRDREHTRLALAALNSNLFNWFFTVFSDCRHLNRREIDGFPVDLNLLERREPVDKLPRLTKELMEDLERRSALRVMTYKHDVLRVQAILPRKSKPLFDVLDENIADLYGFTDEELDFIINYDIKYRMGREGDNETEDD